jgi:hypothetical protein
LFKLLFALFSLFFRVGFPLFLFSDMLSDLKLV